MARGLGTLANSVHLRSYAHDMHILMLHSHSSVGKYIATRQQFSLKFVLGGGVASFLDLHLRAYGSCSEQLLYLSLGRVSTTPKY